MSLILFISKCTLIRMCIHAHTQTTSCCYVTLHLQPLLFYNSEIRLMKIQSLILVITLKVYSLENVEHEELTKLIIIIICFHIAIQFLCCLYLLYEYE